MAPKSIWRQPNAVHFQLVHRSQRDIMRHDPDAGGGVLKPFEPLNRAGLKGKSRAELCLLYTSDAADDMPYV